MLHGLSGFRIDGVRNFAPVYIIEIAVISGSSNPAITDMQHGLYFAHGFRAIIHRLIDANGPLFSLGILTFHDDFTPNFHHIVGTTIGRKELSHAIYAVAFGHSATIYSNTRIAFAQLVFFVIQLVVTDELTERIHLCLGDFLAMFEAKPPFVDQRGNRNVEGTVSFLRELLRKSHHVVET